MSQQKSSESNSYSGSGQEWARPFARRAVNGAFSANENAQPNLDRAVHATGGIAGQLTDMFGASQTQTGQARDYISKVLSGGYMNNNPYLQQNIDSSNNGIRNNVNSTFEGAGRYQSGAHQSVLQSGIAQNEQQMRGQDYQQQMARMDNAAGMATQMNGQNASQALAAYGMNAELPYAGSDHLATQLGALFNGGTSNSVGYSPNPIWGAIGAGLGAAGSVAAASDERLKKDIVEIGKLPNGLTAVEWTFKSDPEQARYRGVIAQEVKTKLPEAFIENYNGTGFHGVNYALVGMHMLKVAA